MPPLLVMVVGTLDKMRGFSERENLNIEVHLLRPPPEQSFWVNMIGRAYPATKR